MTFCEDDYMEYGKNREQFFNSKKMYDDIRDFIRIIIQNGYQMKMWFDGMTVCVEYNYRDESMSGVSLEWLDENEYIEKYNQGDGE